MKRMITLLTVFAMACDGGDKDSSGTDENTDTTECDNEIGSFFPDLDATGIYYRTTIEIGFDAKEDAASVTVSAGGTDVAGSSAWDGDTLVFTPSAPLAPQTTYTVTIDYSCGTPSYDFTTSEIGSAADAAGLVGGTYNLALTSGRVVIPAGVGDLLTSQLGDVSVLVGVDDYDSGAMELNLIGALGEDDGAGSYQQDMCTESILFPEPADFSDNPYLEIISPALNLSVQGVDVTISDLEISGAFAPDGSYLDGVSLGGKIDTRPLVPLFDDSENPDPNSICNLIAPFGVSCEDCGGGENYCLTLLIDSMQAIEVAGVTLVEVTAEEAAACN